MRTGQRTIIFTITILIAAAVYHRALIEVVTSILNREGSSHGFFIPILTAMFLWTKRERLSAAPKTFIGIFVLPAALLLIVPPLVFDSSRLEFVSFVLLLACLVILFFGKQVFRLAGFPVLFLVTMTPVSGELYNQAADLTRYLTFHISVGALKLIGVPHFIHGWFVEFPNALLEVAIGCSGIRYLVSYFVFGIAYAYFFKERLGSPDPAGGSDDSFFDPGQLGAPADDLSDDLLHRCQHGRIHAAFVHQLGGLCAFPLWRYGIGSAS